MGDLYEPLPAINDAPPPPPPPPLPAPKPQKFPAKLHPHNLFQQKPKLPAPISGGGVTRKKRRSIDVFSGKSNMMAPSSSSLRPQSEHTRPIDTDEGRSGSDRSNVSKNNNDVRFYCLIASATMVVVSAFTMLVSGMFLIFG